MFVELQTLLETIVRHPKTHAALLNTFSYLEYVGFRKIVKSHDVASIGPQTLQHASEELRHAQLLKRLSMKVGGAEFDTYAPETMLCGEAARDYFETVDHSCAELLREEGLIENEIAKQTYLFVTWLVEVRALDVYTTYIEVVRSLGGNVTAIENLLREEDRHLAEVSESLSGPRHDLRKAKLQQVEQTAYTAFLTKLSLHLESAPRPLEFAH